MGVLIFSSIYLIIFFNLESSEAIHADIVNFTYKNNYKFGNLTFDWGNATHDCGCTYVLFKDVKNVNLHLVFKQKLPEIVIFEKNFNMCHIARIQTGNIFMKEFFRGLLDNIDFVVKCPFKKGVYSRTSSLIYNINSTGLSIPPFITYDKEFMLVTTYGTRVNGQIEDVVHIEGTFKLFH